MNWLIDLFTKESIAQTVLIYTIIIAIGLILGKLRIFGTSLGSTWILFIGLLASYLGVSTNIETVHFLRDFGLILFVYSIGLQVGNGFFASLKQNAFSSNMVAFIIVCSGLLITIGFILFTNTPFNIMTGVMSGAVTNTPGLGAAQAAINDLDIKNTDGTVMTVAYALTYPFGVFGIIFTFFILKKLFQVDIGREQRFHQRLSLLSKNKMISFHLNLDNEMLIGQPLKDLFDLLPERIVVSRMINNGQVITPTPQTVLAKDDVLLIVAPRRLKRKLMLMVGAPSNINLKEVSCSTLVDRTVVVTRPEITHTRLGDLSQLHQQNFTLSRLNRSGIELMPEGDIFLQLGDRVKIVGTSEGVEKATAVLGNELKKLDAPELAPIFLGIALGIVLGSIPLVVPGVPIPVKLGLAAGPLIVALLLSRFGGALYMNNYTTVSANLLLREIGITFFLASVGLASGHNLGDAFSSGKGWIWIAMGICITIVPLLIGGFVAHKYFRKTYFETCGLLAGASTDPPALAFAIKTAGSDIPSNSYATVYPLAMILRIVGAQMLILLFS